MSEKKGEKRTIKCLVWDLDDTLWDGVLLEDENVFLKDEAVDTIKKLDSRGILQSIASKNDYFQAMAKLKEFQIDEYFLYPQIHWSTKVTSIETIAKQLNIGLDTIAFIDDQTFEREEVNFSLPDVLCIDSSNLDKLLEMPEMTPRFITEDSEIRRRMYLSEIERQDAEEKFAGPKEEFLATLDMVMTISEAKGEDLRRAEELTERTNQLNSTGVTYSYDELNYFLKSDRHKLIIASLEDKYGKYGKIGLALLECHDAVWTIKLLLMSCRVMSRGVGTIMLNHISQMAKEGGVKLRADFKSNGKNRMMYVTYKFAGFEQIEHREDRVILENRLNQVHPFPDYLAINIEGSNKMCPYRL